jgi:hypothetical protein
MTNLQLYVNENLVDLSPQSFLAINIKYLDLSNLTSRFVNYTNAVKLPDTLNNRRIFGFVNLPKARGASTYTVRAVQNGLTLFSDYIGVLTNLNDGFSLSMYSSEITLISSIENKTIQDAVDPWNDLPPAAEVVSNAVLTANKNLDGTAKYPASILSYGAHGAQLITIVNKNWANANSIEPWEAITQKVGTIESVKFTNTGTLVLIASTPSDFMRLNNLPLRSENAYTITLNFNFSAISGTITLTMYGQLGAAVPVILGSPTNYTTIGAKTLTVNLTSANYDSVYFAFVAAAASTCTLDLTDFTIVSNMGGLSLGNFVDIRAPLYMPLVPIFSVLNTCKVNVSDIYPKENSLYMTPAWSDWKYPDKWINARTDKLKKTTSQVMVFAASSTPQVITNWEVVYRGGAVTSQAYYWWEGTGANRWECNNQGGTVRILGKLKVNFTISGISGGASIKLQLPIGNIPVSIAYTANGTYTGYIESTEPFQLLDGFTYQEARIYNSTAIGAATVTIHSAEWENTVDGVPCAKINWMALLPAVQQKDFVKEMSTRYCALLVGSELIPIDAIADAAENILDWTNKRDRSKKDVVKRDSGYAKKNIFKDDTTYTENEFSSFSIDVPSAQTEEKVIYTSIFAAPKETKNSGGAPLPLIPIYDDTSRTIEEPVNPPSSSVLLRTRPTVAADGLVYYGGASVGTVSRMTVYSDVTQTKRSDWKYFIENYYKTFSRILNNYYAVTRYYNLTDTDIQNILNPGNDDSLWTYTAVNKIKKIYDDGELFLITDISNYTPGKLTKVELIKI